MDVFNAIKVSAAGASVASAAGAVAIQAFRAAGPLLAALGVPEVPRTTQEAVAAISEITLDAELSALFGPLLLKFGFTIETRDTVNRRGTQTRAVSWATNHKRQFYFISVPDWLLDDAPETNIAAFNLIPYFLPKNSTGYVLSRNLLAIHPAFNGVLEEWRDSFATDAEFISWKGIKVLLQETNEGARISLLRLMLKLEGAAPKDPGPAVPVLPASKEVPEEVQNLVVEILVDQAGDPFSTPQDVLQELVMNAGLNDLGKFTGRWDGDPDKDARKLVVWASKFKKEFPADHPRANQSTLGWLLKAVIDKRPSPDVTRKLVKIIFDGGLIRDKAILDELLLKLPRGEAPGGYS